MTAPIRALRCCRGFTLTELLVGTAILGLVMAGVLGVLKSGQESYRHGANQMEAQQTARMAMERLVRDIRGAGIDPKDTRFAAITQPLETGFMLHTDWDGSGVIEPGITVVVNGVPRGEQVTYSLVGQDLRRQESAIDAAPQVLARPVERVNPVPLFQYLDVGGNPTNTPADIRSVVITFLARQTTPSAPPVGDAGAVLTDRVRLRNRP